jgi:epoxyqueuosine reductase QueG
MTNGMMVGAGVMGVFLFLGAQTPTIQNDLSEPLSEYDCADACRDCQKACDSKSAGSQRTDCQRACTASATGCCVGYGKKPPTFMGCYCQ